jgi:DNA-binding winged helix-turn-helix (wHTH) protein/Tfp pilus assembly protein PilF
MEPASGTTLNGHVPDDDPIVFGAATWRPASRTLTVRGQDVKLPWRVIECLAILAEARGGVVTRETLEERIWGGAVIEASNLAKCIATLRKALDPAPGGGSHIETAARIGYRLTGIVDYQAGENQAPAEVEPPEFRPAKRPMLRPAYLLYPVGLVVLVTVGLRLSAHLRSEHAAEALVQQGLTLVRQGNMTDGEKAVDLFQQAVSQAPEYAPAYAGLAEAAARFGKYKFEAAAELANKSLSLDPNCGECQAIWGYILMTREWRWKEAGKFLAGAVREDANKPHRLIWYAMWLSLHGRLDEALEQADQAVLARPNSPQAHSARSMVHFLAGRYQQSLASADTSIALGPSYQPGHYWLGRAQMMLGNDVNVVLARASELGAWGNYSAETRMNFTQRYETLLAARGRAGLAKAWIDEVGDGAPLEVNRYQRAVWFAWAQDYEPAIGELEAALKSRPYWVMFAPVDPAFRPVRSHPRFRAVVKGLGFDQ